MKGECDGLRNISVESLGVAYLSWNGSTDFCNHGMAFVSFLVWNGACGSMDPNLCKEKKADAPF